MSLIKHDQMYRCNQYKAICIVSYKSAEKREWHVISVPKALQGTKYLLFLVDSWFKIQELT